MFCRRVRRELVGYVKGISSPRLKARLDRHLERCPGCRRELDGIRETLSLYHSAGKLEPSPGFESALTARLGEAKERHAQRVERRQVRSVRLRVFKRSLYWALAAGAAVLVAVSLRIHRMEASPQEIFVSARPELAPRSRASFRVFVRNNLSLVPAATRSSRIQLFHPISVSQAQTSSWPTRSTMASTGCARSRAILKLRRS